MFDFAWPWALMLLPLAWFLRLLLPRVKPQISSAVKVPFFSVLKSWMSQSTRVDKPHWLLLALSFFVWICLVLAVARPQWLGTPLPLPRQGRNVMLAVDLSGSMQTRDIARGDTEITRLAAVKSAAKHFIHNRDGDRLGLILFGSKAYLQTPLTFDRKTVESMLDDATVGLAGEYTAIGDAIGLAIKRLRDKPKDSRVLILLTDGVSTAGQVTPVESAKIAKKNHIKIYTIGLSGGFVTIQTPFGKQRISTQNDLDEATLKQVARLTGGRYFRARDAEGLKQIYAALNRLEPSAGSKKSLRPIKPLYPWPLGLALFCSVFIICLRELSWPLRL